MNKILSIGSNLAFQAKCGVALLPNWTKVQTQIRCLSGVVCIRKPTVQGEPMSMTRNCTYETGKPFIQRMHIATHSQTRNNYGSQSFSTLLSPAHAKLTCSPLCTPVNPIVEVTRSATKFSLLKGRRKTQSAVKKRFLRLDWGGWISAIPGRARHLWKKSAQTRTFLKNHVLRNAEEVRLLDKMVTKYWVKKKYFVDDPYESYHTRDNYRITKGVQGITSTRLFRPSRYVGREKHCK